MIQGLDFQSVFSEP